MNWIKPIKAFYGLRDDKLTDEQIEEKHRELDRIFPNRHELSTVDDTQSLD